MSQGEVLVPAVLSRSESLVAYASPCDRTHRGSPVPHRVPPRARHPGHTSDDAPAILRQWHHTVDNTTCPAPESAADVSASGDLAGAADRMSRLLPLVRVGRNRLFRPTLPFLGPDLGQQAPDLLQAHVLLADG